MAVTEQIRTWHSVYRETDHMASAPASIDLMAMLVNFLQPQVIVEAGTYRGHCTLVMGNVLRVLGKGTIYTSDVIDNFTPILNRLPQIQPFIKYYQGDFLRMLDDVPRPIDLAYIDASDPDNPHLRLEHAHATMRLLRPGGLLLVDDTESPDWSDAPRFRLWAREGGIHLCQHRGLTIIQKERYERAA